MKSPADTKRNKQNTKSSTGPNTAAGKAQVSSNAPTGTAPLYNLPLRPQRLACHHPRQAGHQAIRLDIE